MRVWRGLALLGVQATGLPAVLSCVFCLHGVVKKSWGFSLSSFSMLARFPTFSLSGAELHLV